MTEDMVITTNNYFMENNYIDGFCQEYLIEDPDAFLTRKQLQLYYKNDEIALTYDLKSKGGTGVSYSQFCKDIANHLDTEFSRIKKGDVNYHGVLKGYRLKALPRQYGENVDEDL